jgi:CheY-like chemotaxis protein
MISLLRAFGGLLFNRPLSAAVAQRAAGHSPLEADPCTVLAIDDDPDFLESIRLFLYADGFKVLTSTSGAKGLDMLRYARDVRVILLDYNMPQLTGAETLAHIRKLNPCVKVIAVTAVDVNLVPRSYRQGVDKLIQKPVCGAKLVDTIDSLLGRTDAR